MLLTGEYLVKHGVVFELRNSKALAEVVPPRVKLPGLILIKGILKKFEDRVFGNN